MAKEVHNPMYTPSEAARKRRGDKYPDAKSAFEAASKRISAIKAKSSAIKKKLGVRDGKGVPGARWDEIRQHLGKKSSK